MQWRASAREPVVDPEAHICHHVTHPDRTGGQTFGRQILDRCAGGRQQQIGRVIGENPVVFLRHPAVSGPKTGFEVRER